MTFAGIVQNIVTIANVGVIPLLYALAVVYIFIGIVRYFFIEGGAEGQEKGKKTVIYGLIGIVVIFAVWGIVNIMLNTLNSVAGTNPAVTNTPATNTNFTQ
jgi:Type IV secretion system pilin